MRMVALLVAIASIGCGLQSEHVVAPAPAAPYRYEPARDPVIGPAWVQATVAYVVERCKQKKLTDVPTYGDPPSVHTVDAGGLEVRQACGLVVNEVYTAEFRARFAREICNIPAESAEGMDEPCEKRFAEMFIARLSERYASADWATVSRRCTAHPFECKTPLDIERNLLASHNAGIAAWYDGAVRYAQARQQVAYEEERAAQERLAEQRTADRRRFWMNVGNAVSEMGKAMQPPPSVNCTSNQVGSTTYTNCR